MIYANFKCQTSFSSAADGLAAWGLKNYDTTFIRQEIQTFILNMSIGVMQLLNMTNNQLGQIHFFLINKWPN